MGLHYYKTSEPRVCDLQSDGEYEVKCERNEQKTRYQRDTLNDSRGYQVPSFIKKNRLNILNDGRHTKTLGSSKSAIDLTVDPPLTPHPIQECYVQSFKYRPLCDNCKHQKRKFRAPNYDH